MLIATIAKQDQQMGRLVMNQIPGTDVATRGQRYVE